MSNLDEFKRLAPSERKRKHKVTSINLRPEQKKWLKDKKIMISPLIRAYIDELMGGEK